MISFLSKGKISALVMGSLLAFSGSFSANAGLTTPDMNDPVVVESLEKAEGYLKNLTTVSSRFIQANADGSYFEGDMYMHRPGRMRFEYDEPIPFLLVADGTFFIHVDKQLEQTMHIPLGSTPANFLLDENLSLQNGLTLSGFEKTNGLLRFELYQTEEPDLGSMLLTFTDKPLVLKQWTVKDAQQNETTVTLVNPTMGQELDPELFKFIDPWSIKKIEK